MYEALFEIKFLSQFERAVKDLRRCEKEKDSLIKEIKSIEKEN